MTTCSQCGKPAVAMVGENPLCVECYHKLEQATQIRVAGLMELINYLTQMSEAAVGIRGVLPKFQVPRPVVHADVLTFHNINVDRSVVGSINTGEVQQIDVAIEHVRASGDEGLVEALKEFTEAVIAEAQLNVELRNEIVEQIAFLASQAALPKEKRRPSVGKAVMVGVKDAISGVAALVTLWERFSPLFAGLFK